jgi:hypothetical protein
MHDERHNIRMVGRAYERKKNLQHQPNSYQTESSIRLALKVQTCIDQQLDAIKVCVHSQCDHRQKFWICKSCGLKPGAGDGILYACNESCVG